MKSGSALAGNELLDTVAALMVKQDILRPSDYLLRRALATSLRVLRRTESEERFRHISRSRGVASLEDLPLAQRWRAAREILPRVRVTVTTSGRVM